ncbi:MAG: hypothetical protein JRJ20_13680 [Deltaproteobacteria bacterium]|nr:hypothetical protein [Deltaproteobacteria bacterium]MBW2143755.1 hypothetical protein [Deltaproteobacteria bacterium]
MKKKIMLLLAAAFILSSNYVYARQYHVLENRDVKILFEAPLARAAKGVADIYPQAKTALESTFGWDLNFRPSVLLITDREHFKNMAVSPLIVAFAVPNRSLIVIDYTKMARHPYSIENTLKHELCHLLLHYHIPGGALPRWLDEGVCQWVSDWIGDIIMDQKRSYLNKAALKGSFISLRSLHNSFPSGKEHLLLAYEESKSFVAYILSEFGKEGILSVLDHMKKGENVEDAFFNALATPLVDLEIQWRYSIRKKTTWFTLLSFYLYEILFGLMALLSIYAFIKIMLKKRAYMAEDPEDHLLS